jgi:predicted transcriptional regulator YdeE
MVVKEENFKLYVHRTFDIITSQKFDHVVGIGVQNSNCLDDAFILYNIEQWTYTLMFYMYIYV